MNELTLIDTIVKYSKDCIILRFVKGHWMKSLFLAKRIPRPFRITSADSIKIVVEQLDSLLNETENDIAKLLYPLFEGKDFGYDQKGKSSLSISEIRDGYILLKEVAKRDPSTNRILSYYDAEFVILLRPLKSQSSGLLYDSGVLYKLDSGGIRIEDLNEMGKSDEALIANDLLNIIIKKKTAYEYLE